MKQIAFLSATVLVVMIFIIVVIPILTGDNFAIDTCLDRGGAWDYDNRLCLTE